MGFTPHDLRAVVARVAALAKTHLLTQNAESRVVDALHRNLAALNQAFQVATEQDPEGHLDVLAGKGRLLRVPHPEDEIRHHESLKAPSHFKNAGQEFSILAAPFAVDAVVGAHHRSDPLVDHAFEMGQIDLVQGPGLDGHIDLEASVLHRIEREMLGAGHDVTLYPARQRGAQGAEMMRILAISFLGAAPGRVAQQVDADATEIVAPESADFASDGVADALFQRRIPGCSPRHGDRKGRSSVQNDAARPIGEADAGNS